MAEEFEESDVVFTANYNIVEDSDYCLKCFADSDSDSDEPRRAKRKKIENTKKTKTNSKTHSKPQAVNIPVNLSLFRYMEPRLYDYEYDYEEDGEMVPPHVMVRRRMAKRTAFSVCSGIGRTLKGRDLSEMRNSVLRMTGFLET